MQKFVIYKRLSKEDKSRTQHGFDSQQMDVEYYLSALDTDYQVVGTFQEFVSGAADTKPELEKAMHQCKEVGAVLLVAKLDRLSRRVSQIANYMEGDVQFRVSTMPSANNLMLHIYAACAEEERHNIRTRVKRGLAAAKAKGVKLGAASDKYKANPNNPTTRNRQEAIKRIQHLAEPIKLLTSNGRRYTLQTLADDLTANGYNLPSGKSGVWKAAQVGRVMDRLNLR